MSEDEFYPTIKINITSGVEEVAGGWAWQIEAHFLGPDDIIDRQSVTFSSKKEATENFLERVGPVISEMLKEV